MSKITLDDIANFQTTSSASTVNNNSDRIEEAIENTLSRDGTSPNQMDASLDMNSNPIYNLPPAGSDTEPVRRQEWLDALAELEDGNPATILDNTVTNAKLADMDGGTIKGALVNGDPQDLTGSEVSTIIEYNIADGDGGIDQPLTYLYTRYVDAGQFDFESWEGGAFPNNATPYDNMISYCRNNGIGKVYIPSGDFYFTSAPTEQINFPLTIVGNGTGQTVNDLGGGTILYRRYDSNDGLGLIHFTSDDANDLSSTGSSVRNLAIIGSGESDGGSALAIVTEVDVPLGRYYFEDLLISDDTGTASDMFSHPVYLDGTLNTNAAGKGIRFATFVNCNVFGGRYASYYLSGVKSPVIVGGSGVLAGGLTGKIHLTGSAAVPTENACMHMPGIDSIELGNFCDNFSIQLANVVDITWSGATNGTFLTGRRTGTVTGTPGTGIVYVEGQTFTNFRLASYTVAGLPSSSSNAGAMVYVSNAAAGAAPYFSDGTNWRSVVTRDVVA